MSVQNLEFCLVSAAVVDPLMAKVRCQPIRVIQRKTAFDRLRPRCRSRFSLIPTVQAKRTIFEGMARFQAQVFGGLLGTCGGGQSN